MSTIHTLSSLAAGHQAGGTSTADVSAAHLPLFPITANHDESKFRDIQVGPNRTIMPTWQSKQDEQAWRKEHLVLCLRALHRQGLAEGAAGHCSTRDPLEPHTFWVNPQGRSFARLRVSDLVRIDSRTGAVVEPLGARSAPVDASASSIHAPIYRQLGRGPGQEGGSETGAEAIVHVHGPHSKAFSALGRPLDRINQDVCAFDGDAVLVPFGGVVVDAAEGERIASFLEPNTKVALLQNHGPLSIGRLAIDEAAWWQMSYEMCCKAQLLFDAAAHRTGRAFPDDVVRVGDDEVQATKAELGTSEMGWFQMGPYIEDELWASKGEHLL